MVSLLTASKCPKVTRGSRGKSLHAVVYLDDVSHCNAMSSNRPLSKLFPLPNMTTNHHVSDTMMLALRSRTSCLESFCTCLILCCHFTIRQFLDRPSSCTHKKQHQFTNHDLANSKTPNIFLLYSPMYINVPLQMLKQTPQSTANVHPDQAHHIIRSQCELSTQQDVLAELRDDDGGIPVVHSSRALVLIPFFRRLVLTNHGSNRFHSLVLPRSPGIHHIRKAARLGQQFPSFAAAFIPPTIARLQSLTFFLHSTRAATLW